ncbi:MAG: hypothetical protein KBS81_00825 [Spirochaetales bacterium]|nr:hypothetical protein [Candidatus Physcosoma equi]
MKKTLFVLLLLSTVIFMSSCTTMTVADYYNEGFSYKDATYIYNRQIYIGMPKDAVLRSWGRPTKINTSTYAWGVHEQLVYESGSYEYHTHKTKYVYIENGKVSSWSEY